MKVGTVVEALGELGGVTTRARLVCVVGRQEVDRARGVGDVVVLARGRYALPGTQDAVRLAHGLSAPLSYRHAAVQHGWAVKHLPDRPDVTLPDNRRLDPDRRRAVTLHRASLGPDDVVGLDGVAVTSPDRTLLDCLRGLAFDEALAVADSALRSAVPPTRLAALVRDLRGPGSAQARRVAREASHRSAGPFESVLRAIALDVPGLRVRPQVPLFRGGTFLGRPDLVDDDLGIVAEADSFSWHGGRAALAHEARRYDELAVAGWLVLRFAYEHVLGEPAWVRSILEAAVAERSNRPARAA